MFRDKQYLEKREKMNSTLSGKASKKNESTMTVTSKTEVKRGRYPEYPVTKFMLTQPVAIQLVLDIVISTNADLETTLSKKK